MTFNRSNRVLLIALIALGLQLTAGNAFGQPQSASSATKNLSLSFYHYKPKSVASLNDLPPSIRSKVEDHLRSRVGEEFYSRLSFVKGVAIDLDELIKDEPETKSHKWAMPSYQLLFMFADPGKGLTFYRTLLDLDANGDVVREIALPEISKHPEKATIIPLKEAIDIASKSGIPAKEMLIHADYDEKVDSIVWYVEGPWRSVDRYTGCYDVVVIDAHSGSILRKGPHCAIS